MCLVGGEAGWGWVGWGVLLNNPHVCLAGTRPSSAATMWTTASASTASAASLRTANQSCATPSAPWTQHTSNRRRPRVACDEVCQISQLDSELACRIEQQRQRALSLRAEAERAARLERRNFIEMESRLPSLQAYLKCVRADPMLRSLSAAEKESLAWRRRCEEWHDIRAFMRHKYQDPLLLEFEPWDPALQKCTWDWEALCFK